MKWFAPWEPIETPAESESLLSELKRELPASHPLSGLAVRAIGRSCIDDDVLFEIEDGSRRVALVHLTWRADREVMPWPATSLYEDFSAWTESTGIVDG